MSNGWTVNYDVTAVETEVMEVPENIARREIRRVIFDDESTALNLCQIIVYDESGGTEMFRHNIRCPASEEIERKGTRDNPVMSLIPGSVVAVVGTGVGDITFEYLDVQ